MYKSLNNLKGLLPSVNLLVDPLKVVVVLCCTVYFLIVEMATVCVKCTLSVNDKSPGIPCGFCASVFHAKCIYLNKDQLAFFNNNAGAFYKCDNCRGAGHGNSSSRGENCNNCSTLIATIKALQATVEALQKEVRSMKENPGQSRDDAEAIINEVCERQRREKNIIIYGLEQITGNTQVNLQEDKRNALHIVRQVVPELVVDESKVVRLGKSNNTKPAPVRVQLSSREDVSAILKNKRKLRERYAHIMISTDNTPMQREQLRKVLQELNERKARGEDGLFVKYVRGNPSVGKSAPKN